MRRCRCRTVQSCTAEHQAISKGNHGVLLRSARFMDYKVLLIAHELAAHTVCASMHMEQSLTMRHQTPWSWRACCGTAEKPARRREKLPMQFGSSPKEAACLAMVGMFGESNQIHLSCN